ncbi:uncharacterized protein LOC111640318 [Centruroides sculpturatus]|uniref:uncharacterized protein LOC111640318 n=1 Tax=Centruroides sculpturatus TaxID=218467 RepID=UPI000C6E16E5|nr:uncharacterized protein LOC111640318 [Centruroides sculpturatus]
MVREICIIEDFIYPKLNNKEFGYLLEWEDQENGIFRVFWSHKSGRKWQEKYFEVFTEWDKMKGRKNHGGSGYFTEAKGRFRSALTRLKSKIETLPRDSHYRRYQLKMFQRDGPVSANRKNYNAINLHLKDKQLLTFQTRSDETVLHTPTCDSKLLNDDFYTPQIKSEVVNYDILNDQILNSYASNSYNSFQPNMMCSSSSSMLYGETEILDQNSFFTNSIPQKNSFTVSMSSNNISTEDANNYNTVNYEYTYDERKEYGLNSIYDDFIPPIKD